MKLTFSLLSLNIDTSPAPVYPNIQKALEIKEKRGALRDMKPEDNFWRVKGKTFKIFEPDPKRVRKVTAPIIRDPESLWEVVQNGQ